MTMIKSLSVDNGDMYYIRHSSDNFSIIDCNIVDERKEEILDELKRESDGKQIIRFISTHPDEDHIHGIEYLDEAGFIPNFYCVDNKVAKDDETSSFKTYKALRDGSKAFKLFVGCRRKWMNRGDEERGSAGINILWPDTTDAKFKEALSEAETSGKPNNISPAIKYSLDEGVSALWLGDMESDYMESIENDINLPSVDILFAPHHGRKSGRVPKSWLDVLDPKIIVVGKAPSDDLTYYPGYNTLTQNSAGDILFDCQNGKTHVYVSSEDYTASFLDKDPWAATNESGLRYLGTFECGDR